MLDAAPDVPPREPLLRVENLSVSFRTERGLLKAVENLSFTLAPGEILSVVGESGSGKSLTSLAVMGLIDDPNAVLSGSIRYKGRELMGHAELLVGVHGAARALLAVAEGGVEEDDPVGVERSLLWFGHESFAFVFHHKGRLCGAR